MRNFLENLKTKFSRFQLCHVYDIGLCFFLFYVFIISIVKWIALSKVTWDGPFHLYIVRLFKEGGWPWFSAWDPHALGGFVAGGSYPSLFHWIMSGLLTIFSVNMPYDLVIIKIAVVVSIALTFYFFCKLLVKLDLDSRTIGITLFLYILYWLTSSPQFPHVGVTFHSALMVGLFPQVFFLPLFILFVKELPLFHYEFNPYKLGLYLGLLNLGHAWLFLGAALFIPLIFYIHEKQLWRRLLLQLSIAFGIWLLISMPILYHRIFSGEMLGGSPVSHLFDPNNFYRLGISNGVLIAVFEILFFIFYTHVKKNKITGLALNFKKISWYFYFVIIGLEFVAGKYPDMNFPLHAVRLLFIPWICSIVSLGILISREYKLQVMTSIFVVPLLIYQLNWNAPEQIQVQNIEPSLSQNDRGLVVPYMLDPVAVSSASPHWLVDHLLEMKFNLWNGLTHESHRTGKFVHNVIFSSFLASTTWHSTWQKLNPDEYISEINNLGINWLLSQSKIHELEQMSYKPIMTKVFISRENNTEEIQYWYLYRMTTRYESKSHDFACKLQQSDQSGSILKYNFKSGAKCYVNAHMAWHPQFVADDKANIQISKSNKGILFLKGEGNGYVRFERSRAEKISVIMALVGLLAAGLGSKFFLLSKT